jgi:hypothetical protein
MQDTILKYTDLLHTAGAIDAGFHNEVHAAKDKTSLFIVLALKVLEIVMKVLKKLAAQRKA